MGKSVLALVIFFYILALFQTSFLVHFNIKGIVFNFILIAIILINLFERPQNNSGFFSAFFGGFFLDIFSERFFGFWILILVAIAIFIKIFLRKYVRLASQRD